MWSSKSQNMAVNSTSRSSARPALTDKKLARELELVSEIAVLEFGPNNLNFVILRGLPVEIPLVSRAQFRIHRDNNSVQWSAQVIWQQPNN